MCAQKATKTFSEIQECLTQEGYVLISTEYKGTRSKSLIVECPERHTYTTRWNDFQQGYRCPRCRKWKGEEQLGELLEEIFPGKVNRQDNLGFLCRQRVDYSVRHLKLAFEYDGEQHFRPVTFGSLTMEEARRQFKRQQRWDEQKEVLCERYRYRLVRMPYNEPLTYQSVKNRIGVLDEYQRD